MRSRHADLKASIITLREQGKSYGEIRRTLKIDIPKSTLSYWCNKVLLTDIQQRRVQELVAAGAQKGRTIALLMNEERRALCLQEIERRNKHLAGLLFDKDVAKIALAVLYLGEGAKSPKRGYLMFGNSDPLIIDLFLQLLRRCYNIDEKKFRCTLQCRADQNIKKLEKFWARITNIPSSQFYKARPDPRTIGKPSRKLDYKGVCRIDYFSAEIFFELMKIPRILHGGLWSSGRTSLWHGEDGSSILPRSMI